MLCKTPSSDALECNYEWVCNHSGLNHLLQPLMHVVSTSYFASVLKVPLFSRIPTSNGVLSLSEGVKVVEEYPTSGLVKEVVNTERSLATTVLPLI